MINIIIRIWIPKTAMGKQYSFNDLEMSALSHLATNNTL